MYKKYFEKKIKKDTMEFIIFTQYFKGLLKKEIEKIKY